MIRLYHTLIDLSRGNLDFFGFCSRHIPNIVSACGVWFTFVFRTPTHHAVGSWGEVLCSSRGLLGLVSCPRWLSLRVASPSPFVPLLYHNLGDLSRVFFEFLSNGLKVWWVPLALLTSLTLYHTSGDLSRGFLSFFKKLFEVLDCGWRLTLSPRTTRGLPHISWVGAYLPLTLQIIAHLPTECNRQNTQNREK